MLLNFLLTLHFDSQASIFSWNPPILAPWFISVGPSLISSYLTRSHFQCVFNFGWSFFVFGMMNLFFGMLHNESWMGLVHIAHKSWMDGPLENRKIPTELSWCGQSNDDNKLKVGTPILAQMGKIHWGPFFGNWRTLSQEYAFWAFEEQAIRLPLSALGVGAVQRELGISFANIAHASALSLCWL